MKRQITILGIPVTVKCKQLWATIYRVLLQIKQRHPKDFARLQSQVLAIVSLPYTVSDENYGAPTESKGSEAMTIIWSDIEDQAHDIFNVWGGVAELDRARLAWDCVVATGLADYSTSLEETIVKIRLLVIAAICLERRFGTWKDKYAPIFEDGLVDLEINPFRIGQIAGTNGPLAEELSDIESQWELMQTVVIKLIEAEMPTVRKVIDAGPEAEWRRFVEVCDGFSLSDQTRQAVCDRLVEMTQPWAYMTDDDEAERSQSNTFLAMADRFRGVCEGDVLQLVMDYAPHDEWAKDLRRQYEGYADRVMLMSRGLLDEYDIDGPMSMEEFRE